MRQALLIACLLLGPSAAAGETACPWRTATAQERTIDAEAFEHLTTDIGDQLTDIQSVVLVVQGRTAYQYYRDGNPEALREVQSVAKSALAVLVGAALQQGQIASLDTPVVELVPAWRTVNPDPRAHTITLQHLLAQTSGFEIDDPTGTAPPLAPEQAWKRPMRSAPGQAFAYDNSGIVLIGAILQRVTGQSVADYSLERLAKPLDAATPLYSKTGVKLRTLDMAKLGQLFLQDGRWNDQPLLPPGFAALATSARSAGGAPVQMPYGLSWWVTPSGKSYFASGYAGQMIWVHPPLGMVVAVTSTVLPASQQRNQALQLIRGPLFQAVRKRWRPGCHA